MKRRFFYVLILMGLILLAAPLDARTKKKGITTSLESLMVLMNLSQSLNSSSRIYIDAENCQCACDLEKWSCLNTECEMQDEVCMDVEVSYDVLPWQFSELTI